MIHHASTYQQRRSKEQEVTDEPTGLAATTDVPPRMLHTSAHVKAQANNPHYQGVYGKERMAKSVEANQCPVNDHLCEEAVWFT